jgi:hypothetical protein
MRFKQGSELLDRIRKLQSSLSELTQRDQGKSWLRSHLIRTLNCLVRKYIWLDAVLIALQDRPKIKSCKNFKEFTGIVNGLEEWKYTPGVHVMALTLCGLHFLLTCENGGLECNDIRSEIGEALNAEFVRIVDAQGDACLIKDRELMWKIIVANSATDPEAAKKAWLEAFKVLLSTVDIYS